MQDYCLEVVAYEVEDPARADHERRLALDKARALPGFLAWTQLTGTGDAARRVDLVAWKSEDAALAAAREVGEAAEFAGFRATISGVASMGHYAANQPAPVGLLAGDGLEIGRFRLKPGVTEAQMRAAHAQMVERHLSRQPGWRGQRLLRLDHGVFLDLAVADSRTRAIAICESWTGTADCEAFLALIEAESMEFGEVV